MTYADIMLPVPLDGLFTYSVPDAIKDGVRRGRRVLVPFGSRKTHVGIVISTHDRKPDFAVKDIKEVLDDDITATDTQINLWNWIAEYYMSPVGDVMNAALPAALKDEREYRPKTETYVTLSKEYRSAQALNVAREILKRSVKQNEVFNRYLELSHWNTVLSSNSGEEITEVTRDELVNDTHCTSTTFRNLVVRKILCTYEREVGRINNSAKPHPENTRPLSDAQNGALEEIKKGFSRNDVILFQGVTSSGKTEIYIHLIQQALDRGGQVLYLLPEIALTVQMCQRLSRVFGSRLGIYHSGYSDAERVEIWRKQLSSSPYDVILGARSAVFLPFRKLGLVIIDEEHESSFKQQDPSPRYHARSVAIMLARMSGAKTLLGSATPSVESLYNAQKGKYGYVRLDKRFNDISLPEIRITDVKDLRRRKMMYGPLSPTLLSAIRAALDNGKQAILFQNRRGFAPMIECKTCGWTPRCDKCDVSLTYHKRLGQLTCHYCGKTYDVPDVCPCCGSRDIRGRGYGTEKIEDKIMEVFPDAAVARMDLDTTRSRNAYEHIINDFAAKKTNILVGTQMISKGLDFDNVAVVGILDADSMLNYPDFRAYEHAFTMMQQVAGRAGRKGSRGLVILQTVNSGQNVIGRIMRNEGDLFFKEQLEERSMFNYPPFCHLIYIYLKHRDDAVTDAAAISLGNILRQWFGNRVLGPDKPAVARIKTLNIRKIVIKLENGIDLAKARLYLKHARNNVLQQKGLRAVQIYFDVDPS